MPRCPVCRTKYVVGKVDNCSLCGWNLQPYSLVVGLVPEVMLKEQTRLEWAQALWASVKFYREQIQQFQLKLKDTEQTTVQLRSELEQVKQTRDQFQTNLLYQSERVNQELIHLRSELEKVKEAQNHLEAEVPIETVLLVESQQEEKEEKIVDIQPEVIPALTINKQTLTIYIVNVDAWGNQIDCYQNKVSYFQEKLENLDLDLELVELPSGEFWMGSQTTEQGREIHEEPQHLVKIEPFYMSRFPITQSQWRVIANLPTINRSLNPDPSNIKGDNQPVEQVSWYDAVEFCERLAHATKRNYRLPSEAEWEYACRAGTSTPFHFGETITSKLANYDGNYIYNLEAPGEYCQRAVAVDNYKIANAFGLVDMHGNVWEWCYDPWHDNYHGATCDGSVWSEGGSQNRRLLRGGAWYCLPSLCRSAQRHWDEANHGGSGISFRVVFSV